MFLFSFFLDLPSEATEESESETLLQTPPEQAEVNKLKNVCLTFICSSVRTFGVYPGLACIK